MKPIATLEDGREIFSYPSGNCVVGDVRCMFYKPNGACLRPRDVPLCAYPSFVIYVPKEQYLLLNLVHGPAS